jgi:hypothetical protein
MILQNRLYLKIKKNFVHKHTYKSYCYFVFVVSCFFYGCSKLDTTTIGGGLIPEVDNIHTFADTFEIETRQEVFDDTTKITPKDNYVIGKINDPYIGETNANLFFQLKPSFFPYYIGQLPKDSIVKADSVVLCLSYKGFWGIDSLTNNNPPSFQVYEVSTNAHGEWDSVNTLRSIKYEPSINPTPISDVKYVDVRSMNNYVKVGINDSAKNQIRIKLNQDFLTKIFNRDSSSNNSNGAYKSDSLFRLFNNGFAVVAKTGNGLIYVNLLEDNSRLELHYKKKSRAANDSGYSSTIDTVYNSFFFNTGYQNTRISSVANRIIRNRINVPGPTNREELCIQATPGTYATLSIPRLDNFVRFDSNRIIHRAEIQILQIPDVVNDKVYTEPKFLYLDLFDTGSLKWKPIYYDLNPSIYYNPDNQYYFFPSNGEVDLSYFGGVLSKKINGQAYYNINITRYLQQLVTKHTPNYKMRLYAPYNLIYPQYNSAIIPFINKIGYGRVKIGGGANTDPNYKMKLRVIYSKINK